MKRILLVLLCSTLFANFSGATNFSEGSNLAFIENHGQFTTDAGQPADMVHFRADVSGLEFYLTETGLSYVFVKHNNDEYDPALGGAPTPDFETTTDYARVDMILRNAVLDKNTVIREAASKAFYNYYYAHCPDGITQTAAYHKITYQNVYPNIDWVIYSENGRRMKYEFLVHPGGDPADIQLEYKYADLLVEDDRIALTTPMGQISEEGLYAYVQGSGMNVPATFVQNGNIVSINTQAPANGTLVIDPPLIWSTYWGGSGGEQPQALVSSFNGYIYVGGYTNSTTYPTSNPGGGTYYQGTFAGSYDAFVAQFDTSGVLYWSTYYGGSGNEGSTSYTGISIACGQGTDFWMVGTTSSTNLPVQSPGGSGYYQPTNAGGSYDFFVVKFNLMGIRQFATYVGGSGMDGGTSHGNGADTDNAGNLYFSGKMLSTNFPLVNPGGGAYFDNTQNGSDDLMIVKMTPAGQIVWSTIFGGSSDDMNYSMDLHVDKFNNKLYLGTCSMSTNVPCVNPGGSYYFDNTFNGGTDMYLGRFSLSGVHEWGTYVGGTGAEWLAMSVNTAPDGDVAMITLTGSTNMPLVNPGGGAFHDPTHNGGTWDMYVCRFEETGQMSWSTYYGSSNNDHCQHNLTMDMGGNIIMAGVSDGTAAPVTYNPGAGHFYDGTKDAQGTYCLVQYDPGGVMLWGTFWGGSGHDHLFGTVGGCIGVSAHSDIFLSAETNSTDLVMLNPGGGAYFNSSAGGGGKDGFVVKFDNDIIINLPVRLGEFTGRRNGNENELYWTVANPAEANYFVLEREEGTAFEPLVRITSEGQAEFTFTDRFPNAGSNYYRLKMVDKNGAFVYSNVVEIRAANAAVEMEVYPNPATEQFLLNLQQDGSQTLRMQVMDLTGRTVLEKTLNGSGIWSENVSGWVSGTYLVTITDTNGKMLHQEKLVVE